MSLSYVRYVADGTTDEFDVPFPFVNRTHIKVIIDGNPPVLPIRWAGESRIKIADRIAPGSTVEIRRETPISVRLVDFQNGSVLTEEELDTALNQIFFLQQELRDRTADTLNGGLLGLAENEAAIDAILDRVLSAEAALEISNAVNDIANQGAALAALALDTSALDTALEQSDALIAATQASLATAESSLQTSITAVDGRVSALRGDHTQLVSLVDSLAGGDPGTGIATLIQEESNARIDGDTALAETLSLIGAKSPDGLAFVLNTATARVSPSETLAERLSVLSATDANNAAAIIAEQSARLSGDEAVSNSVSLLDARVDGNEAAILSEQTARASGDAALATDLNALTARVGGAEAVIVSDRQARVDGDTALASDLSGLTARVGTAESAIVSEQTARANGDSALTTSLNALVSRVGTAESAIVSDRQARVDGDAALTTSLNGLTARVGNAESAIVSEEQARAAGDAAEASARSTLTAVVNTKNRTFRQSSTPTATATGDLWVHTGNANRVYRWSGSAWVETSDTRIASNQAAIVSEQTARANGDSALASDLSLIGARTTDGSAWQLNLATVRVSPSETLSTRLNTLAATDASNAAAVATEQTARVNGDNALASSISALTTTVNGNTATVTQLASSVNGLSARYGVSLDVNGYVTGFVQNNDGQTGNFAILADRFSVVHPNGGTPVLPFEVRDGAVFMREAFIGTLNVARITSGILNASITQNADWNVGTGRIIWDNGTHMKVAGVGFGSSNQFIEWFGAKRAINTCTEANAIQYLKTNGDAYFGGSLSAGILRNSAQSTDIGASSSVTVGPFGTNGNAIQVITGYSAESQNIATYPATTTGRTNWQNAVSAWGATPSGPLGERTVDATKAISCNVGVRLDRSDGVSSTSGWAILTISSGSERLTGTEPNPGDGVPGDLLYRRTVSGAITSTDNAGGTLNRTFTATITTRTNATLGTITRQSVSVTATEE